MADEEKIKKLQMLLKELFQFDNCDLDFGMYRILNIKRDEIKKFIENDLFEIINENLTSLEPNSQLEQELETLKMDIVEKFGCNIEEAKHKYRETPIVQDYIAKENDMVHTSRESEIESEIYDDIVNFFSRYYDDGDFISKRRYSKNAKYAIPYNGEEVYLYWATQDQYYVKTSKNFKNYSFSSGSVSVDFEITNEEVEVEQGNVKDENKKYFIFHDAEYDSIARHLRVKFGYRNLTDAEETLVKEISNKKGNLKDQVKDYNLSNIKKKIAIWGISDLEKKHINMDGTLSDKSELEWHLNKYTTENTSDYFIHKNLKKFLTQELDIFIKNELLPDFES